MLTAFKEDTMAIVMKALTLLLISAAANAYGASDERSGKLFEIIENAKKRPIGDSIILFGQVKPRITAKVTPDWTSIIEKILVKQGDMVKKGQIVARASKSQFNSTIDFRRRYATYAKRYFDFLNRQLAREIASYKSIQKLVAENIHPKSKLTEQRAKVLEARDAANSALTQLKRLRKELNEVLDQARSTDFIAPIAGKVSASDFDAEQMSGSFLAFKDSTLAMIEEPNKYTIRASVLDMQMRGLEAGALASISVGDAALDVRGSVVSVVPQKILNPDGAAGVFTVEVHFDSARDVPLDSLAKISIEKTHSGPVLSIPWNAITRLGSELQVKIAETSEMRPVTIGKSDDQFVEIVSGLSEGEAVVSVLW